MTGRTHGWLLLVILGACEGAAAPDADTAAPPVLAVEPTLLDFGDATGEPSGVRTVTLRNEGQAELGIDALRIEDEAFAVDGVDCPTPWESGSSAEACRLGPGEEAEVQIRADWPGDDVALSTGALLVETDAAPAGPWADPARAVTRIGLRQRGCNEPLLEPLPRDVLLEYNADVDSLLGETVLRNPSWTHRARVRDVSTGEGCERVGIRSLGFDEGDLGPRDQVRLGFSVLSREVVPVDCAVSVTYDNGCDDGRVEQSLPLRVRTRPAPTPPSVTILSPLPGAELPADRPFVMTLAFEGLDDAFCKVRSVFQGRDDGTPAIADCAPGSRDTVAVTITPGVYPQAGVEVLEVRATSTAGTTFRDTVAVRIGVDPAPDDADEDGFGVGGSAFVDCDDTRADIHPLAAEKINDLDDDCDGLIPEQIDRDGDGQTAAEGDCDDRDPTTYAGASELRDRRDNDCDGRIDEHTRASDDDGDGRTELDGDCDDADPTVGPDVEEVCGDGIDNDCNRFLDSEDPGGCRAVDADPVFVGGMLAGPTAVEPSSVVRFRAAAYDPRDPGSSLKPVTWSVRVGEVSDEGDEGTVLWPLPEDAEPGTTASISASVVTAEGRTEDVSQTVQIVPPGSLSTPVELPSD